MKVIISTLLTLLAATAAQAEGLQVETRAFHANLRLDADKATYLESGEPAITSTEVESDYFNSAGFGVSAVQAVDDVVELGLGLSMARYFPTSEDQIDQVVLNAFSRINLLKTDSSRFYILAGLSRQQLTRDIESDEGIRYKSRFTPIVNGDLGLGASFKVGSADLGLEYKYSNTLATGRSSSHVTYTSLGVAGPQTSVDKTKFKGVSLEGQELALTFAVKL